MQVRYTGYRDRPQEERQVRFENACREGHTEIAFTATGTNLQLVFTPPTTGYMPEKECDYEKEPGKVRPEKKIDNYRLWRPDGSITTLQFHWPVCLGVVVRHFEFYLPQRERNSSDGNNFILLRKSATKKRFIPNIYDYG